MQIAVVEKKCTSTSYTVSIAYDSSGDDTLFGMTKASGFER